MTDLDLPTAQRAALVQLIADLRCEGGYYATADSTVVSYDTFSAIHLMLNNMKLSSDTCNILLAIVGDTESSRFYNITSQRAAADEIEKALGLDAKDDTVKDEELPYLLEEQERALRTLARQLGNGSETEQLINVRYTPLIMAINKIYSHPSLSESTRRILQKIKQCDAARSRYTVENSPEQHKAATEIMEIVDAIRRINSSDEELWKAQHATEKPSDASPDTESSDLTAEERRHLHGLCWALLLTDATIASVATEVRKPLTSALAKEVAHYGLDSDKGPLLAALGYALDHELRIHIPAGSTQYDLLRAVADDLIAD